MTSAEIRQSFLDFFREKQHTVVSSSSLLPDSPNLLFTNAGMNQFVPIFLGQQKPAWNPPRVVDTQKCIRAGGKHNDLEDVGLDTYHHTFFEMLGNWSFGDYFKKEAIEWAWELVVRRWKFPPSRVYATVYCPDSALEHWNGLLQWISDMAKRHAVKEWGATDYQYLFFGPDALATKLGLKENPDLEAAYWWAELFYAAGVEINEHVVPGNRKDNFWMMGDTGPCGPCSELHVDLTPAGDTKGSLVNTGDPRCIEIWNLVFIQFNANADGSFVPLPERHVDTGMGFERVTAIIQGTKSLTDFSRRISNYETDVFRPIFDEVEKLSGKKYGSTVPNLGSTGEAEQEKIDVAFRVIADHIRTLSFAIADGIQPSNEYRGYVARRILRRAVRYGRVLGFYEPFFFKLVDVLVRTAGDVFVEIRQKEQLVRETIRREEESFNKTLDKGIEILDTYHRGLVSAEERSGIVKVQFLDLEADQQGFVDRYAAYLATTRFAQPSGWNVLSGYSRYGDVYPTRMRALVKKLENADSAAKANALVREIAASASVIEGDFAFKLYDTYGFPLDLTELIARERGLTVDVAGFEKLMGQQRERARKAQKKQAIQVTDLPAELEKRERTNFVGYDDFRAKTIVLEHLALDGRTALIFGETPFYAESGGQVADTGVVITQNGNWRIVDTQKSGNTILHFLPTEDSPNTDIEVDVIVDANRRIAIQRHHTVTHILHWALHELVSREATQKGSYVGPEKLTFDFSSAALTKKQVRDVEKLVSDKIAENVPVSWTEVPYPEAKKRSDIQQFFGDKYGDVVRVVQIGGTPNELNGYSMELCGGTHVRETGEIESFRIVREEAIAAGIRRIEAVAGGAARDWAINEAKRQDEKFHAFERKKSGVAPLPAFSNEAETNGMLQQIEMRAAHLEKLDAEVREWEKQNAKETETNLRNRAAAIAKDLAESHAGQKSLVSQVAEGDGKLLQAVADALKAKFSGPIFLAGATDGTVALIASVPDQSASKTPANKLIQEVAAIVGGKGGGRPENARGAGNDPSKIDEALARARELIGD